MRSWLAVPVGVFLTAALLLSAGEVVGQAVGSFRRERQLFAPRPLADDYFGSAVAIDGDTAVIGKPGTGGTFAGAAYVYVRTGSTWTLQQTLTPSVPINGAYFGYSVAISGGLIVVGAFNSNAVASQGGAAYLFTRVDDTWYEQWKFTAADATQHDWFGYSVAISGMTVLIGTRPVDDAGSAYVFVPDDFLTGWILQQKLMAADGVLGDTFGYSVALSGDTALVGATSDDTPAGTDTGAAYAFVRSGNVWTQQQKLTASDGTTNASLGNSVALEGDTAIVGAQLASLTPGSGAAGAAYVFVRSGTTWTEQRKLSAKDAAPGDIFGHAVALSGNAAIIGAYLDTNIGGVSAGSAYVFVRSGSTWVQQTRIVAADAAQSDTFGSAVALSGDTALVSAPADVTAAGSNAGSTHIFRLFAKGDMDRDGQTDLLVRLGTTGLTEVWRMAGVTRPLPPIAISPTPTALEGVVVASDDFNFDRSNDLLVWNSTSGVTNFWFMNGSTRVGTPLPLAGAPPPPWKPAASADFNRDGRPDIVWRNSSTQKIAIWAMNGSTFVSELTPNPDQAAAPNWEIVGAQDWNGDGDTDLLWYNPLSGKVVLWFLDASLMRIAGQFTNPPNAGNNNWKVLAMGDYGIGPSGLVGTIDLVWRNTNSGRFVIWYMDQAGNRTAGTFTSPDAPAVDPTAWTIVSPR